VLFLFDNLFQIKSDIRKFSTLHKGFFPYTKLLCAKGLTIRYFLFLAFFTFVLAPLDASARGNCHSECQELFRDLSFGSPLIGLFYLIAPIFGFIVIFGKKATTKKYSDNSNSDKVGRTFYVLSLLSLVLILVVEFART